MNQQFCLVNCSNNFLDYIDSTFVTDMRHKLQSQFSDINILRCSAVICLKCGGLFGDYFFANFQESMTVKEF